jgi:hypothetical protein
MNQLRGKNDARVAEPVVHTSPFDDVNHEERAL